MLMSGEKSQEIGLKPKAKLPSMAAAGVDPKLMGLGVIPAARKALQRAGLTVADIGLAETNEAFAVVAMVAIRELGIDEQKVNPNGGAVALGHPMGCTGARLITTLVRLAIKKGLRQARIITAEVDIELTSSKAVIMIDGEVFAYSNLWGGADSPSSAQKALDAALASTGIVRDDIHYLVGAGRGAANTPIHTTV
jgi:acetyl-CoA acetyltransferase